MKRGSRVALVPTGQMEYRALADALKRRFPEHEFVCLPMEDRPLNGFTSTDVRDRLLADGRVDRELGDELERLISTLAAAVDPAAPRGRRDRPFELAVLLDDVELVNRQQAALVVDVFRQAVGVWLEGQDAETRALLAARVSFHLAMPMTESWFFAEQAAVDRVASSAAEQSGAAGALARAGAPLTRLPALLEPTQDAEDFLTTHEAYLQDDGSCCVAHHALRPERKKKDHRIPWLRPRPERERHPKAYLQWLCCGEQEKGCTTYKETQGGVHALRGLDWGALQSAPAEHLRYLRALINDLAEGLGEALWAGEEAPYTSRVMALRARRPLVLRNVPE